MNNEWIDENGELQAGIYHGIRDAAYQKIDALRASTMKAGLQSPLQLRHRMNNKRADTGALRMGRAVHLATLQPDAYAEETMCAPDEYVTGSGTLSTGKKSSAWLTAQDPALTVLTPEEDARAFAIAGAVEIHPEASVALATGHGREVTALWEEVTPQGARVWCKARADFIGGGILGDVKTTRETQKFNANGVGSIIAKFSYHFQHGWYHRGFISAATQSGCDHGLGDLESLSWLWIFVQSGAPHDVIVGEADEEMQDLGAWYAQAAWEAYSSSVDSGEWLGVCPEKVTLQLPRWAVPFENDDGNADGVTGIKEGKL